MDGVMVITPCVSGTVLAPYTLGFPRLVAGTEVPVKVRERRINVSRAICQEIFLKKYFHKYEFVLLMDSDVEIGMEAVERLMEEWKPGTTPCAITKGSTDGHVVCACALVHRSDYEKVDYFSDMSVCQCFKLPKPFYVLDAIGKETK